MHRKISFRRGGSLPYAAINWAHRRQFGKAPLIFLLSDHLSALADEGRVSVRILPSLEELSQAFPARQG